MPIQIRRTPTANNPPINLAEGQLAVEMATSPPRLWCGVPAAINSSERLLVSRRVFVGDTPPANPSDGDLWWDGVAGDVYMWLAQGNGQWVGIADGGSLVGLFTATAPGIVPASGGGSANFLRADGTWSAPPLPGLFTSIAPGIVPGSGGGAANFLRADGTWDAPVVSKMGVTDGSNAAPGEVGELLRVQGFDISINLVLPPGDWDIYASATMNWSAAATGLLWIADTVSLLDYNFTVFSQSASFAFETVDPAALYSIPIRLWGNASISASTTVFMQAGNSDLYSGTEIRARRVR